MDSETGIEELKVLWDLDALKTQRPGFLKGFVASLKDCGTYIPLHIASLKDSNVELHKKTLNSALH